jgi:hypothetical protein
MAIRSDDQLENRFQPFPLPRWEPDAQGCSLLASFAAALPLRGHHVGVLPGDEGPQGSDRRGAADRHGVSVLI